MKKQQIEAWALRVIEQVKQHQHHEDSLVELKRDWPDDKYKAARRIAGHANSAHGEPILWLIGVDENTGPVTCSQVNLADWLAELNSYFIELTPSICDLNIPIDGLTVVALLIETDRAPYVVKNPGYGNINGGAIASEVPWRQGTAVKTASRAQLLSILSPANKLPEIELREATLFLEQNTAEPPGSSIAWRWVLHAKLYISHQTAYPLVIPFHRTMGILKVAGHSSEIDLPFIFTIDGLSHTMQTSTTELLVSGPGSTMAKGAAYSAAFPFDKNLAQSVSLDIKPVGCDLSATVPITLEYDNNYVASGRGETKIPYRWFMLMER